jgi:hypothetical protein
MMAKQMIGRFTYYPKVSAVGRFTSQIMATYVIQNGNLKALFFQPTKVKTEGCPFFKKDTDCPALARGAGCPIKDKATKTGCPLFGKDATCSYLQKTPGCPFFAGVKLPIF